MEHSRKSNEKNHKVKKNKDDDDDVHKTTKTPGKNENIETVMTNSPFTFDPFKNNNKMFHDVELLLWGIHSHNT
jgi:hypothetical protein